MGQNDISERVTLDTDWIELTDDTLAREVRTGIDRSYFNQLAMEFRGRKVVDGYNTQGEFVRLSLAEDEMTKLRRDIGLPVTEVYMPSYQELPEYVGKGLMLRLRRVGPINEESLALELDEIKDTDSDNPIPIRPDSPLAQAIRGGLEKIRKRNDYQPKLPDDSYQTSPGEPNNLAQSGPMPTQPFPDSPTEQSLEEPEEAVLNALRRDTPAQGNSGLRPGEHFSHREGIIDRITSTVRKNKP